MPDTILSSGDRQGLPTHGGSIAMNKWQCKMMSCNDECYREKVKQVKEMKNNGEVQMGHHIEWPWKVSDEKN